MDTEKIKKGSEKVAEVRDKAIGSTLKMVDKTTNGKGNVFLVMALLVAVSYLMDLKILAFVFLIVALADVIAKLIPEGAEKNSDSSEKANPVDVEVVQTSKEPREKTPEE